MGNCSFKVLDDSYPNFIRVLTCSGSILVFRIPMLAREVLENYPGYGIFLRGHAWSPLADHERLIIGQFYYLLPLRKENMLYDYMVRKQVQNLKGAEQQIVPPKMSSADFVENLATGSDLEVLPSQRNGVWKVKLVIDTKQLGEILSEQGNTEAMIEKMRMAATAARLTPHKTKSSWVVGWKPAVSNVFKMPIVESRKQKLGSSPINCNGS